MTTPPPGRGRFAPSPTGPLHLGNLRTALLAWLFARHAGAAFVLRDEDLDTARVRPGAARAMLADLRWLGLDWDEGPDVGGPHAPYTQSERLPLYRAHLERLLALDLAYPCYCSRKDIAQAASAPHAAAAAGARYSGACRDPARRARIRHAHPDRPPAFRFRAHGQRVTARDRLAGPVARTLRPGADDFVLWRADGVPAYQLAVVVDDALMRIGEVVRGADLLECTPWQVALYQSFGYPVPAFAHVPLLRDERGERLAKREAAAGLDALRAAGTTAPEVVGMLGASCGLVPPGTVCTAHALPARFAPERLIVDDVG